MKTFFILMLLLCQHPTKATNYYFSTTSGLDARSSIEAQNVSTPWKTVNKLNSFSTNLKPRDSIFFKRDEIFFGTLLIHSGGTMGNVIFYGSYGSGANPVITGFTTLSDWTLLGGNIYYASLDVPSLNIVTLNGEVKAMGRYPNTGYLKYEAHSANISITDNEFTNMPDFTGGEVVIRKFRWILDRHPITSQSGTTITYSSSNEYGNSAAYAPVDENGYFIQGHLNALDRSGEWFYDNIANRLYMHFGSARPADKVVKASTINKNITINTYKYITFGSITFEGGNTHGAYNIGTSNITYNSCIFRQQGGTAIYGIDVFKIKVDGGSITDVLNNGIWMEKNCDSITIDGVSINNSGIIPGAGRSGDSNQEGIYVSGNNVVIQNCRVVNSGYVAINFEGSNVLVEHNFIDNFCTVKDDGGGIYTYTGRANTNIYTNRRIIGNIILNGRGASEGTDDTRSAKVHGIYIDNTRNVEIKQNTIAHCRESGIFVYNSHNLNILKNIVFDNATGLFMMQDFDDPNTLIRNNAIRQNTFFSKNDIQMVSTLSSIYSDIRQFGAFDTNYYCRPLGKNFIIGTAYDNPVTDINSGHDLWGWQKSYNKDLHSKSAPQNISPYTIKSLTGFNIFNNEAFNNNISGVSAWSPVSNCKTSFRTGNRLDGGALEVTFTAHSKSNTSAYITLDIGAIDSLKNYVLKFSLLGTKNTGNIQIYLRKKNAPYNDISVRKYCAISSLRSDNEFLFSLPSSEKDAFLTFQVNEYDSTLWFDNVKLYEADIELTDPDNFIRFEYNATNTNKIFNLNKDVYIDVENNSYQGNVLLAPWSSLVLMKVNADKIITPPSIGAVAATLHSICSNATTTLAALAVRGTDSVVTWWTGPGGTGSIIDTGLTITARPGTYYARVTGYIDSAAEAIITIASIPVTTSDNNMISCGNYTWNGIPYTSSGNYIYYTTNAAGCDSMAVLHLTVINATSSEETINSCNNYSWKGAVYSSSGEYTYHTLNAAGCDSTINLHLAINRIVTKEIITNAVCYGTATGAITLTATGGTAPYQYKLWGTGIYQSSGYFSGLQAGSFNFYIQDANGCVSGANKIVISQPVALTTVYATTNLACYGTPTGSAKVTATGGTAPYQYKLWSNGVYQISGSFTDLRAGSYNVYVKDANGCTSLAKGITLRQPTPLNITYTKTTAVCYGAATGSINVTASGGMSPYLYKLWKSGVYKSAADFTGLKSGSYNVYVQDANGCTTMASVNISQSKPLKADHAVKNASFYGAADGSVTVMASGGSGNYVYQLENGPSQPSGYFAELKAGTFKLSVTDKTGCGVVSIDIIITQPCLSSELFQKRPVKEVKENSNFFSKVELSPNPSIDTFRLLVHSKAIEYIQIRIIDTEGRLMYAAKGLADQAFCFGETFVAGHYYVELSRGNSVKTMKAIKIK